MNQLSKCIFKWSSQDLKKLTEAKHTELKLRHLTNPSVDDVLRWLSKNELALPNPSEDKALRWLSKNELALTNLSEDDVLRWLSKLS